MLIWTGSRSLKWYSGIANLKTSVAPILRGRDCAYLTGSYNCVVLAGGSDRERQVFEPAHRTVGQSADIRSSDTAPHGNCGQLWGGHCWPAHSHHKHVPNCAHRRARPEASCRSAQEVGPCKGQEDPEENPTREWEPSQPSRRSLKGEHQTVLEGSCGVSDAIAPDTVLGGHGSVTGSEHKLDRHSLEKPPPQAASLPSSIFSRLPFDPDSICHNFHRNHHCLSY